MYNSAFKGVNTAYQVLWVAGLAITLFYLVIVEVNDLVNLIARVKEDNVLHGIKSLVLFLIIMFSIVNVFYPNLFVKTIVSYITIVLLVFSLPFAGRSTKIVSITLFVIGAYLMYISHASLNYWTEAMSRNTGLLVLLIVVPLLGIPLKYAGYIQVLDSLAFKYTKKGYQQYWLPSLFSHGLGFFMNIGAVSLTYDISARGKVAENAAMLARAISRGTGTIFLWSPNTVAVALVLEYVEVPWTQYFYLGFSFAVIALVCGYISEILGELKRKKGKKSYANIINNSRQYVDKWKLIQLLTYITSFLLFVLLIEIKSNISVISMIPVVSFVLPAFWLSILGYKKSILNSYFNYFTEKAHRYDGEVVLFVAAGFFSSALIVSGYSERLCDFIMSFSGNSTASITFTILGTIVLGSLIGIHPMISVSTFAASLDVNNFGFSPVYLALVLAGGWSLGSTISPISGNILVVANVTGRKSMEIVYGNLMYAVFVFLMLAVFASIQK